VKWGLERIHFMLDGLGRPQDGLRSIHVGGTNGKGTVAATADAILREAGHSTGLYTSPHLVSFSERITIGGSQASGALLESCATEVLPLAEEADATFFEATTALAFSAFARSGVTTAVVEVGLGGRLDATNVIDADVSVVTSIALDHADYLGSDLQGIAREKAGIFRSGRPAILGPVDGDAGRVLRAAADAAGAPKVLFDRDFGARPVDVDVSGTDLVYRSSQRPAGIAIRAPVVGEHQVTNVAIAICAVELFGGGSVSDLQILSGVEGLRWPGRFQVEVREDGTWVYDIAHNPAAAVALADVLSTTALPRPIVLLGAVLGDKPARHVIGPLLSLVDHGILTIPPSAPRDRAWDPERAFDELVDLGSVEVIADFDSALATARDRAGVGTVLVAGSCHTVGDAMRRNESA
jgi:dihydrofolate synthase/folylpolyglutamate synthase